MSTPPSETQSTTSPPNLSNLSLSTTTPPPLSSSTIPLSSIKDIASHIIPPQIPAHRSHDPSNNLKRSEPFQFGSRYLEEGDNVYDFNAWDHVETDPTYKAYAEHQYTSQRENPVSPFDKKRFNTSPEKWWNKFYANNTSNFFKNRKWLRQEFPILADLTSKPADDDEEERNDNGHNEEQQQKQQQEKGEETSRAIILEVGAGAGNTAFPLLASNSNPGLLIHACDFSPTAIELIKSNAAYNPTHILASVWDISSSTSPLPPGVTEASVDVVLLIFIFSALNPRQWKQAVRNVWRALKPGGEVCFRDYGRGDLAQVRFKKGRYLEENFYIRGDGTRVYFFEEEELRGIWGGGRDWWKGTDDEEVGTRVEEGGEGRAEDGGKQYEKSTTTEDSEGVDEQEQSSSMPSFEIVSLGVDRRLLVNRQKQLKMYRSVFF
ncbi:hypothetical protein MMC24_002846 [Lignoscripta atroalba]|nr:hypothetical protein [Lignoscripta atroalba]